MKSLKLSALLLGAALFLGLGVTTLSAGMKCGAGKCGSSMKAPKTCDDVKCAEGKECKCGPECKCEHKKSTKAMKCGGDKQNKKKAMKCGAGKCG